MAKVSVGSAAVITAGLFGVVSHMTSTAAVASRTLLATYRTLAAAPIKTAGAKSSELHAAEDLWRDNGAVLVSVRRLGCPMARDQAQSLVAADLGEVAVHGLVHEDIGDEVELFRKATGWKTVMTLQHDVMKRFFPLRSESIFDMIKTLFTLGTLSNTYRALTRGHTGTGAGDVHMRGGVVVMGPGDQGVLYEHWELEEYGTPFDLEAIKAAIAKFATRPASPANGERGSDDDSEQSVL